MFLISNQKHYSYVCNKWNEKTSKKIPLVYTKTPILVIANIQFVSLVQKARGTDAYACQHEVVSGCISFAMLDLLLVFLIQK